MTIYNITGWGKGKTTSAIGIAARALANGEKVLFCQFLKGVKDSGIELLKPYQGFYHLLQETKGYGKPDCSDFWDKCIEAIQTYKPHLIIFDELNVALDYGLFHYSVEDIIAWLKIIANQHDVYITGRINKHKLRHQMIEMADIATNCYCEAHNYNAKCTTCGSEFPKDYFYCPLCGQELTKSIQAKEGREC